MRYYYYVLQYDKSLDRNMTIKVYDHIGKAQQEAKRLNNLNEKGAFGEEYGRYIYTVTCIDYDKLNGQDLKRKMLDPIRQWG